MLKRLHAGIVIVSQEVYHEIVNAMIARSVEIGGDVWVSPSASSRQKLSLADKALGGLGSVFVKSVEKGVVVAGKPSKPFEKK